MAEFTQQDADRMAAMINVGVNPSLEDVRRLLVARADLITAGRDLVGYLGRDHAPVVRDAIDRLELLSRDHTGKE